jgi:uncharacterized phage infection (PIP) family protein YhgE
MKAEEIAPIAMPGKGFGQHAHRTNQTNTHTATDKTADIDSKILKTPSPDRIRFNKLEAANSQVQQLAQHIRQVNQSMETIDSHLSEMRAKLEHIVKIYPPYPPGSAERIEAIRQFSALRKMIDQMTRSVEHGPAGASDLETPSSKNKLSIDRLARLGQGELDIPEISASASDEQLSGALERTIAAQADLQVRQHSFIAEVNRIMSELG